MSADAKHTTMTATPSAMCTETIARTLARLALCSTRGILHVLGSNRRSCCRRDRDGLRRWWRTPLATLADDGCTYEGDTTFEPGVFNVAVENDSSRFATFSLWGLRQGSTPDDLEQLYGAQKGKPGFPAPATDRILGKPVSAADVEPGRVSNLPANESAGRYVVVCLVHPASDTRQSSTDPVAPDAVYAAAELRVGDG
jgi:hypothetical protein